MEVTVAKTIVYKHYTILIFFPWITFFYEESTIIHQNHAINFTEMIGIKWIETDFEGTILRGHLRFDGTAFYTLQIVEPFYGPEICFQFQRIKNHFLIEETKEFEDFSIAQLICLYRNLTKLVSGAKVIPEDFHQFISQMESLPYVSKQEWTEQRLFLRDALRDQRIDKITYDDAIQKIQKLMTAQYNERDALCAAFLQLHFPDVAALPNRFATLQFIKSHFCNDLLPIPTLT